MFSPPAPREFSHALVVAAKSGDERALRHLLTGPGRLRATVQRLKRECDPSGKIRAAWDPMPEKKRADEAEAGARLGILEALKRFDPSRGVDFVTYAYPFIKGEMLRSLYPSVRRRESSSAVVTLVPLIAEGRADEEHAGDFESDMLDRDREYGRDPGFERLERLDARGAVRRFTASLPPNHRELIDAIFWNERTQDEVAAIRGVSRQAISKTLQKVLARGRLELEAVAA